MLLNCTPAIARHLRNPLIKPGEPKKWNFLSCKSGWLLLLLVVQLPQWVRLPSTLRCHWNLHSRRSSLIEVIVMGRAVLPTGLWKKPVLSVLACFAGKDHCSIIVVISPLISIMKDQVKSTSYNIINRWRSLIPRIFWLLSSLVNLMRMKWRNYW